MPDRPHTDPPLALELLVHGVAGASPAELLGDPRTVRITGDSTAAVFRRTDDADAEAHPERYAGLPVPEAYCWSRLTSGNGARALWLLLLPFMVANLAHWARPAAPTGPAADPAPRAVRTYGVLVRILALSLTVLLIAAACEVAIDLVAWQCAGSATCTAPGSRLGFLAPDGGGWWSQPGRRLALGALVPTALTGLLWYLSNRTWSAYESQPPPAGAADPDTASDTAPALGRPGFWYGRRIVARLRAAHTAAGLLTVAVAVSAPTAAHDRGSAADAPALEALGWVTQALLAAGAVTVAWVVCRRGRSEDRPDHRLDRAAVNLLPGAALALLAAVLLHACVSRPGWTSGGRLPGDFAFGVLMLGQGLGVLALAVVARHLHRRAPDPAAALRGLGGPAVAMLGCALGGVMSGGVAQRVADWMDGGATPGWRAHRCRGRPSCCPGRPPSCPRCSSCWPCSPPGSRWARPGPGAASPRPSPPNTPARTRTRRAAAASPGRGRPPRSPTPRPGSSRPSPGSPWCSARARWPGPGSADRSRARPPARPRRCWSPPPAPPRTPVPGSSASASPSSSPGAAAPTGTRPPGGP